jgi:HAD superfamily hydrolase (TIGR01484 family)
MKFHVLAVDFDGTLAHHGHVDETTVDALVRLRKSGRRLVMVTGRLLSPLQAAFPEVSIFDLVVAENGALLYNPDTGEERPLVDAPPREFVEKLTDRGVEVREVGHVIVATHVPFESPTLETIRDMALELQIVFNKGAVMVLPTGVNKASGLRAALAELGFSRHNTMGMGDAENDEAFLRLCGASIAVDNALDPVKKIADLVVSGRASAGVVQVIERLLEDDLKELHGGQRRSFQLGTNLAGEDVLVPVYGTRMLVTGDSAGGKSKLAVSILEQLIETEFQTCVIDPEGDFQTVGKAIVLGTVERAPTPEEVIQVVEQPDKTCVVSLFAVESDKQPAAFGQLIRPLQEHRIRTGRPHWNIVDEAHYPLSPAWAPLEELHLEQWRSVMYITAFPKKMPTPVLKNLDLFVAIGEKPDELLAEYCELVGVAKPELKPPDDGQMHRAIAWWREKGDPFWLRRPAPKGEHLRHRHQYFEGDMDPPDRFYFRGPKGELNLAAGNLRTFMELATGVDDETWLYHLHRGDYAEWFRDTIRDEELAVTAEQMQETDNIAAKNSRERINEMIRKLYIKELAT